MLEFEIVAPNPGRRSLHTLYVVKGWLRDGTPVLKVGRTRNLDRRMVALASNGLGHPRLLVHMRDGQKIAALEGIWKKHVKDLPGLRVHPGETLYSDDGYTEILRIGVGVESALGAVLFKASEYADRYGVHRVTA